MTTSSNNRGFIALMSVVIISAILLMSAVSVSASTFYARFDALDAQNKYASRMLAKSCVNIAKLRLVEDPLYQPAPSGDTVVIDANTCMIDRVTSVSVGYPQVFTIQAHARSQNTFSTASSTFTIENP